jgi:hypothetical protein
LEEKEEAFEKLQEIVQEHQEARPPSNATIKSNTMIETTMVNSSFLDISQEHFGEFEKNTKGISLKLLHNILYDGQGIGKRRQSILSPIVATLRVKHEGLGFDGRGGNSMTTKTTFVKVKYMTELTCSSKEREKVHEGGNPLPL